MYNVISDFSAATPASEGRVKVICTEKLSEKIRNGQKWQFQIFSNNFSLKDWYKFRIQKWQF